MRSTSYRLTAKTAGEAGRGFAVVANEIKKVAKQRNNATPEIATKVDVIRVDTNHAVEATDQTSTNIEKIHQHSSSIAASVEEQAAFVGNIDTSIRQVVIGSNEITKNISSESDSATKTSESVDKPRNASDSVEQAAQDLTDVVGKFNITSTDE